MAKPDEIKNETAFSKYALKTRKKRKSLQSKKQDQNKLRVNCKFTYFYNKTVSLDSKLILLKSPDFYQSTSCIYRIDEYRLTSEQRITFVEREQIAENNQCWKSQSNVRKLKNRGGKSQLEWGNKIRRKSRLERESKFRLATQLIVWNPLKMAKPDEIKNETAFSKYALKTRKKRKSLQSKKQDQNKLRVNCKFTYFYNKTVSLDSKLILLKSPDFYQSTSCI